MAAALGPGTSLLNAALSLRHHLRVFQGLDKSKVFLASEVCQRFMNDCQSVRGLLHSPRVHWPSALWRRDDRMGTASLNGFAIGRGCQVRVHTGGSCLSLS